MGDTVNLVVRKKDEDGRTPIGPLVLLDARENTFSVPVNRGSSVLAGVVATTLLSLIHI